MKQKSSYTSFLHIGTFTVTLKNMPKKYIKYMPIKIHAIKYMPKLKSKRRSVVLEQLLCFDVLNVWGLQYITTTQTNIPIYVHTTTKNTYHILRGHVIALNSLQLSSLKIEKKTSFSHVYMCTNRAQRHKCNGEHAWKTCLKWTLVATPTHKLSRKTYM